MAVAVTKKKTHTQNAPPNASSGTHLDAILAMPTTTAKRPPRGLQTYKAKRENKKGHTPPLRALMDASNIVHVAKGSHPARMDRSNTVHVCCVGGSGSGRTAVCRRLATNTFETTKFHQDFSSEWMMSPTDSSLTIALQDLAGEGPLVMMFMPGRYSGIHASRGKSGRVEGGFIVVYDITSRDSFKQVSFWLGLVDRLDSHQ